MATIVIGDVHGCLDELDELLALADPRRQHRLVFLGDLMDRGPDPVGVVRRVRELRAACVMGNHDEKHVRWARHEAKHRADPGYHNPMKPMIAVRREQNAALGDDGIAFLAGLPLKLELGDGWWAVHAGAAPSQPFSRQKPAMLTMCRWVDARGAMIGSPSRPPGARHWAEVWSGRESILYGHHVHDLATVRTDRSARATCIGIDTGCCFGGRLTAYVLDSHEVIQVTARAEYAKLSDPEGDGALDV